ncbi:Smr/MutS family protein [Rhizobium sp. L1K21]|uniref:Smr/MutS family protein n=1 Tax=Rhizobium sp. L1K21 TaxID=2954933 RepID=UPI002091F8BB|nr:Smr/MutS family protein [Rhizobium sp. L1K21]MCO6187996.1 Smr/MutS family protein [Rhizobium sp. L1K21]
MTKKGMSHEDRILWGKVARSVRALPGRMERLGEFEELLNGEAPETPVAKRRGLDTSASEVEALPSTRQQPSGTHHPIEKPVKRKISKGRLALEARIDLHGLVQSEAHALLHSFIVHAHERGMRHVLVITGKGSSLGSEGALKRAVPLWFSKPEFRFLISGYEQAARNHGGEGALYVRLKRKIGDAS